MATTSAQRVQPDLGERHLGKNPGNAFDQLFEYQEDLIEQAVKILGDRADAEDVVQETFCEAFRDPARMAQADSQVALLRAINRANALNHLRNGKRLQNASKRKRQSERSRAYTTGGFSVMEAREIVQQLLEQYPPQQQEILKLRYENQLTHEEIARRTRQPLGTVSRILFETAQKLFLEFQRQGPRPAGQ